MSATVIEPQHMTALQRANEVRLFRADLKGKVARGEVDICSVVARRDDRLKNMRVSELIECLPRYGVERTIRLLGRIPMSYSKTFGTLTDRQRCLLCAVLAQPWRRV